MKIEEGVPVLFSPKQVSEILNISRSQVYVLFTEGELRNVKLRGSRRVTENQLLEYIWKLEGIQPPLSDNRPCNCIRES
jgi:excisionase family DNA binding protein